MKLTNLYNITSSISFFRTFPVRVAGKESRLFFFDLSANFLKCQRVFFFRKHFGCASHTQEEERNKERRKAIAKAKANSNSYPNQLLFNRATGDITSVICCL